MQMNAFFAVVNSLIRERVKGKGESEGLFRDRTQPKLLVENESLKGNDDKAVNEAIVKS